MITQVCSICGEKMQLRKRQMHYVPFVSDIYYASDLFCPTSSSHPIIRGYYYPIPDKFVEITPCYLDGRNLALF